MDEKISGTEGSGTAETTLGSGVPEHNNGEIREELIWEGSPCWKADFLKYVGYSSLGMLLFVAAVVGGIKAGHTFVGIMAGLIIMAVFDLYLLWITIMRRATIYRITNLNIQVKTGVFTTTITNLETWRIRDSSYHQSFMEKLLGIGTVRLHAQDEDTPVLELVGLPADENLYEKIKNAYVVARQRKNILGLVAG